MDRINALYLAINPSDFAASPLKKHSKWYGNTFKVWCSYWPDAIKSLTECYYDENKKAVIKKSGSKKEIDHHVVEFEKVKDPNPDYILL